MGRKSAKKPDNKLRWKNDTPEVEKLRQLIPEAEVKISDRRVLVSFPTRTSVHRCIDHILASADEDVLPREMLRQWATSWGFETQGGVVVRSWQTWHLSREAVLLVLAALKTPVPGR